MSLADFQGFDSEPVVRIDDRFDYGEGHCLVYTMRGTSMRLISFRRARERRCVAMVSRNKPPVGFDENPEWIEEDFAKARPASEVHGPEIAALLVRKRGRPAGSVAASKKEQVTVRLDPSILAALRAGGPGWQSRMNDMLRKALGV